MRPRRLPAGLLGMLALLFVCESFLARQWLAIGERRALAWRFAAESTSEAAIMAEVVGLGDSLIKLGVVPAILERRLGMRAFNLALPGGQASSTYFVLSRLLEAGGKPKIIVVDFHPNLLAAAPRFNTEVWPELVSPWEAIEIGLAARDPDLMLSNLLRLALPSLKDRDGLREAIPALLDGGPPPRLETHRMMLRNWRANQGGHLAAPGLVAAEDEGLGDGDGKSRIWKPHRANAEFLRRFLDLANARGIAVFWILPPAMSHWEARRREIGIEAPYRDYIEGLREQYPRLVVIDGEGSGYPADVFRDVTHLHRKGAAILTSEVAEVLAAALEDAERGPRVVALPPYRERPEPMPLEDLDESLRVVRAIDEGRERR